MTMMFGSLHGNERQKLVQLKGLGKSIPIPIPVPIPIPIPILTCRRQSPATDVDVFIVHAWKYMNANQPTSQPIICPMRRDRLWPVG